MNLLDTRRLEPKGLRRAHRAILFLAAMLLVLASSCSDSAKLPEEPSMSPSSKAMDTTSSAAMPASLRMAHLQQVQHDAPAAYAFAPVAREAKVRADNLQHDLRAELDARAAMRIAKRDGSSTWNALFQLVAMGRAAELHAVPSISAGPEIDHTTARYRRGTVIEESYLNGPLGIEQGFVIAERPAVSNAEPLSLEVRVEGNVHPEETGKGSIALRDDAGMVVLQYSDLMAHDARGRDLAAAMHVKGSSIFLDIEDQAAEYPVTIDPLVWVPDEKMVQKNPGTVFDQLGNTIAISGDTAIIGAQGNDEKAIDAGAAYVFVKTMTGWVQQQKLLSADGQAADHFGCSVSIDGDTAIVGAYGQDAGGKADAGAAYVFVRANGMWTEQRKVSGTNADDYFGYSVALSGLSALVGAYGDDTKGSMAGAAYVLSRDQGGANMWGTASKLVPDDGAAQDNFGQTVALELNTAVLGTT